MTGTWIEVDLDAISGNYREVVKQLRPEARCMAVVKADAYGLGAIEVAKTLEREGCEAFAVTHIDEGLILRERGIGGLVLVLGPAMKEEWTQAIRNGLQLTVSELTSIEGLNEVCSELGQEVSVHIKLETGMGRTGFRRSELEALARALSNAPYIRVAGIYTHFARAAQKDRKYTQEQYELFTALTDHLEQLGIHPAWKHVCNSAAFLDYPEWHLDFVRIGTLLIGHYPGPAFKGKLTLKDPWVAKTRIIHLRKVPKGTFVGYQSIYRTKTETQLAVIPVGYADGFGVTPHLIPQGLFDFLKLSLKNFAALFGVFFGQERVKINGRTVIVAGKIGMQLTVIDVGMLECNLGDEVVIPLRRTVANPRIARVYIRDRKKIAERVIEEGFLQTYTECSK